MRPLRARLSSASNDTIRTILGLSTTLGVILQVLVLAFLGATARWLPFVVVIGAHLTELRSKRDIRRSLVRSLSGELVDILILTYVVLSVPLLVAGIQVASFLALTVAQLSLYALGRRKRKHLTRP